MIFNWNNKQRKQEEGIQIQSLTNEEHGITRSLWETAFAEDSKEFVDFYYENKATDNSIWVAKEDELILSMVQLNPYQIHLGSSIVPVHYIVGVATLEEYRRQGLMRGVLEASFQQMYCNEEPFTYLMPAKEEYYTGFDFLSVYYQKKGVLIERIKESELRIKKAEEEDLDELAKFSEQVLAQQYCVFALRDKNYYEVLRNQFEIENGGIQCVYDKDRLIGYFFYAEYEEIEVIEPVCLEPYKDEFSYVIAQYFRKAEKEIHVTAFDFLNEDDFKNIVTKPITMVRIINLEKFISYLRASEPIEITFQVEDSYVEQNNGVFTVYIDKEHAELEKVSNEPELVLTIKQLCAICFYEDIPKSLQEIIGSDTANKLSKLTKFTPVFLNEFV